VGEMPFNIVIQEKNGPRRMETFTQNEVTIGRVQGNDIVLPKGNISKRHSRIVLRDGKFIIVDLRSTNGTYVNGKRINAPQVLKDADKVYIGDFTLTLEPQEAEQPVLPPPSAEEPVIEEDIYPSGGDDMGDVDDIIDIDAGGSEDLGDIGDIGDISGIGEFDDVPDIPDIPEPTPTPTPRIEPRAEPAPTPPPPPQVDVDADPSQFRAELPGREALHARTAVFAAVYQAIGQQAPDGIPADDDTTRQKAEAAAKRTLDAVAKKTQAASTDGWVKQIVEEVCGMGPIGKYIDDATVSEIFVNGPRQILVKTRTGLSAAPQFFSSEDSVCLVVRRVMAQAGVPFDEEHPVAEARMSDGTRVNAVHHSVAVNGPLVTITRSSMREARLEDLASQGVLNDAMAEFLTTCVRTRRNILVCGGSGAGVGTMVGALGSVMGTGERIVTVQQVARMKLPQPLVVTLEPRPRANGCAADMQTLVGNALRMRPDRLMCHEVAGPEALDLLIAMGGGQDGTVISCYGHSARDALSRLETMMRLGGQELPSQAVREQITNSIDIVVELTRFADGSSRVTTITEVLSAEVDIITTSDIFTFNRSSDGAGGSFAPTGSTPRFFEALKKRGEHLNMAIFRG
jgi:pilus assembly protein CpaF